jgi:hypothetical protein
VEEKWNAMNLQLTRVIENWEQSSPGDGGYINVELDIEAIDESDEVNNSEVNDYKEEFRSLKNSSRGPLDQHENFFDDKSYLLYLLQVLGTLDLLHSSMQ